MQSGGAEVGYFFLFPFSAPQASENQGNFHEQLQEEMNHKGKERRTSHGLRCRLGANSAN